MSGAKTPPTCWLCGRVLVISTEDNRTQICSLHGTRGTAHLRPAPRPAAQEQQQR